MLDTLSVKRLRRLVEHDQASGILYWLPRDDSTRQGKRFNTLRDTKYGWEAGTETSEGYLQIAIGGKAYLVHRIAWALHYGKWPDTLLDHRNRKRSDNRWRNIRRATHHQNSCNRKGDKGRILPKGVTYRPERDKYQAAIGVRGRVLYLGHFDSAKEAQEAYRRAAKKHHGRYRYVGPAA